MAITQTRKTELIQEYARTPGDTGSPEVQVAILTERIRNLTEHFLFEPRLDPDVPAAALAALRAQDIRLIYVYKGRTESTLMTFGFDE